MTASRVFTGGRGMLALMVKPSPISLRFRAREITADARLLLRRLDREAAVQRRIKHQAAKASLAIMEIVSLAEPQVEKMSYGERKVWQADLKTARAFLEKIRNRGV